MRGDEIGDDLGELVPHEDRLVPHAAAAVVGEAEREVRRRAVGVELDGAARRRDRLVVEVTREEQVGEQRVHERVALVEPERLVAGLDRGRDVALPREPLGEQRLLAAAGHDDASAAGSTRLAAFATSLSALSAPRTTPLAPTDLCELGVGDERSAGDEEDDVVTTAGREHLAHANDRVGRRDHLGEHDDDPRAGLLGTLEELAGAHFATQVDDAVAGLLERRSRRCS